jgi:hypothetical protein
MVSRWVQPVIEWILKAIAGRRSLQIARIEASSIAELRHGLVEPIETALLVRFGASVRLVAPTGKVDLERIGP